MDSCNPTTGGCEHVPTSSPPEEFEVSCDDGIDNDCDGLPDDLDFDCRPPPEDPFEPNDTFEDASPIVLDPSSWIEACIQPLEDIDYYTFSVSSWSDVVVDSGLVLGDLPGLYLSIYDADLVLIAFGENRLEVYGLPPGTYFLGVDGSTPDTGCYWGSFELFPIPVYEGEPNDTFEGATYLGLLDSEYSLDGLGCIDPEGDIDIWYFELTFDGLLYIDGFGYMELYNQFGELIRSGEWVFENVSAPPGGYFLGLQWNFVDCYGLQVSAEASP